MTHSHHLHPGGACAAQVTHADMVARGAYRFTQWIAGLHRAWSEHRRRKRDMAYLRSLDDRSLADIGLARGDLSRAGLAEAARRRRIAMAIAARRA